MKVFPMNLLVTPTYFKSLFNKAILFFPAFLLVSSTIISKPLTSGIFIKSLKNTSTSVFSLICLTFSLKKVGSFNSSSLSGKGMHLSWVNSRGGRGVKFLRYSAASRKAGTPLFNATFTFFLKISRILEGSFLSSSSTIYLIESSIMSA